MDKSRKKAITLVNELPEDMLDGAIQLLQTLIDRNSQEPEPEDANIDMDYGDFEFVSADEISKNLGIKFDEM